MSHKLSALSLCLALAACSGENRVAKTPARPPATRIAPVTDSIHGVNVVDNYRWLEGDNGDSTEQGKVSPEVAAWTDAQNNYTRSVLDRLPGRQVLKDRLGVLMNVGSVTAPLRQGRRYFYTRASAAQSQPIVYWREGSGGVDSTLLDPEALDRLRPTALAWLSPSTDGKLVAYGSFRTGDSQPTLHLMEVDSAKPLPLEIPHVPDAVQWLPDDSGFFYQIDDERGRRGMFHRLSDRPGADRLVYEQAAPVPGQDLPDRWGPFATLSADGHWIVLGHWEDPTANDLWVANFDDVRRTGRLVARVVTVGSPGLASGTVVGNLLILKTTKGAPRGRIVAADVRDPAESRWREIVKERADAVIQDVAFAGARLAVTYRKNASDFVEVFDLAGSSQGTIPLPGIGTAAVTAAADGTEAFITFTSINYPPTVFRTDLANPAATPQLWMAPEVAGRTNDVQVEQIWYPSKDGTKVSMFLAHKAGLARRGDAPTMLIGFGAFGVSVTPAFSPTFLQWFDAGGLLAWPNVRGGGEYGEAWHSAGARDKKQTTFDDFIAAADWLVANKYTNAHKLAIFGGSHGGLLIGAVLTQRPDLCRAAILTTPVLDMLRYERFFPGAQWAPEYGSVTSADESRWLLAYSPYRRIKGATAYPGVLLMADEQDTDVHAMHARKMTAALQAATSSDPGDHPILLRIDRRAGDPQAALNLQLEKLVDQRLFIMWQLGML
jgi:prolyl oligopeptidase